MNEQNSRASNTLSFHIVDHPGISLGRICGIHRYAVSYKHTANCPINHIGGLGISLTRIIVQEYRCLRNKFIGYGYAFILKIIFDAVNDNLSAPWILAGYADSYYFTFIISHQLTAHQSSLCSTCSRCEEYIIKMNFLLLFKLTYFIIAIDKSLGSPMTMPTTFYEIRIQTFFSKFCQLILYRIMHSMNRDCYNLRTEHIHHPAIEGRLGCLLRTDDNTRQITRSSHIGNNTTMIRTTTAIRNDTIVTKSIYFLKKIQSFSSFIPSKRKRNKIFALYVDIVISF